MSQKKARNVFTVDPKGESSFFNQFLSYLGGSLNQMLPEENSAEIISETTRNMEEIMPKVPFVGEDNALAQNISASASCYAFYKAYSRKRKSPRSWIKAPESPGRRKAVVISPIR